MHATHLAGACLLAPLALSFLGCAAPDPPGSLEVATRQRLPDDALAAAHFRYDQRLSADGTMPDNALLKAKAHVDEMIRAQGLDRTGFSGRFAAWTPLGPNN